MNATNNNNHHKIPVYWKPEEIAILGQGMIRAGLNPDTYGFCRDMREVQKALLPEERRKTLSTSAQLREVIEWVEDEKKRQARIERQQQLALAKAPIAAPAPDPAPTPPVAAKTLDDLVNELVKEVAKRFETRLQDEVRSIIAQTIANPSVVLEPKPEPKVHEQPLARPRPPRVMVLGLKPAVISQIKQEYKDRRVDLRFEEQGVNPGHVRTKVDNMDYVITMRWVDHALVSAVKHHPKYDHITGGFEQLRAKIDKIAPHDH